MRDGFIKVAAATVEITVADVQANVQRILRAIGEAETAGAALCVLPELCVTGYTCADLLLQEELLRAAEQGLLRVIREHSGKTVAVFGLPLRAGGKLYNCAAVVQRGRLLGIVPKRNLPDYGEFYKSRYFTPAPDGVRRFRLPGLDYDVPFGAAQIFRCADMPEFAFGIEICEDLWVPSPPSGALALAGATVLLNLSASSETVGKAAYRRELVATQSARYVCGYLYADAGEGESSTDLVFAAHNMIAENGKLLAESRRFENNMQISEIDCAFLLRERARLGRSYPAGAAVEETSFSYAVRETALTRVYATTPYVPEDPAQRGAAVEDILSIQAAGLAKRLRHTGLSHAVVGLSGGLDSTMALLVAARAFDSLGLDRGGIYAVTMPCFGTTERTRSNAFTLARAVGASIEEIRIADAVRAHFADLGHDEAVRDVVYENAQARERTQLLMDLANQRAALVIGTGDLSELALGFATYNGDHMSNYGVNASVPKTLMRHMVRHVAETCGDETLRRVLVDILETPVSPELLPPEQGSITQKTEEIIGDYRLHDFFLYYMLRCGFGAAKLYRIAVRAFAGEYTPAEIKKWQTLFYRRFFAHQFKRSCLPDGPKVGSVTLSPRGDFRMPSDAAAQLWLEELARCSVPAEEPDQIGR